MNNVVLVRFVLEENIVVKNITNISSPLIISLPHSGNRYSADFLRKSLLSLSELKKSEDAFVDELWEFSLESGYCYIKSLIPRVYVDLNRHPLELDPLMISSKIPNFKQSKSLKALSGIGVIPKVSVYGNSIYADNLSRAEVIKRLLSCYFPYHKMLKYLIKLLKSKFDDILILDCHSMPSETLPKSSTEVDIILGNNFGHSISEKISNSIKNNFQNLGFTTTENYPYSGGFITQYYGDPINGIHVLQIEINRSIYMNEKKLERLSNISIISNKLKKIIESSIRDL